MKLNWRASSRSSASAHPARGRKSLRAPFYGIEALESRQLLSLFTFFPARWPYIRRPAPLPPPAKAQPAPKTTTTT
ncbi:MAG TPA: hypothetical protein VGG44_04765, partial [Tepidisphaeraceae bacterium]